MKPFTTVDFQQAKANHQRFARQLRASLYEESPVEDALSVSQYACSLGRWLYSLALLHYEQIQEVHELEQAHGSLHTTMRQLISQYNAGMLSEARQLLPDVEQLTERISTLLDTVETKINAFELLKIAHSQELDPSEAARQSALLSAGEQSDSSLINQDLNRQPMGEISGPLQQVLHDFFMQAPAVHCILTGPTHMYSFVNAAYKAMVGGRNLLGMTVREALPELANQGFFELLDGVYTKAEPFIGKEMPILLENKPGEPKQAYLNFSYQPLKNAHGQAEGILVFAYDVTEQVMARKAIEASEARFRSIIEEAPVATCLFVGRDMRVEIANDLMLSYWGKNRSVLGKSLAEGVPELIGQPFLAILDTVFTTGKTYEAKSARAELELNGVLSAYYFDFTYKPLFDEKGQVYAIIDTAVDVTNQVLAQQQQLQLAAIVEEVPIYVTIANLDGTMRYINPFGQRLLGLSPQEVPTKQLSDFFVEPDMRVLTEEALPALMTSHHWEGKLHLRHFQTGELIPVYTTALALTDANSGQIEALVAVNRDLRPEIQAQDQQQQIMLELRASEERYRQLSAELEEQVKLRTAELALTNQELAIKNEELASANEEFAATNEELEEANQLFSRSNQNLERFAYIASHDLQEPLRKVQQFGDLLSEQYASQLGDGLLYLERMQKAASRMSTLIRDLLSFSRISTWQDVTSVVSLTKVVETVLSDLELRIQETGADITIEQLPRISGDQSQLEQLFQNLLSNALKFRKANTVPRIQIRYETVSAGSLPAQVKPSRQTQTYYCIQVIDNGIGFDEKYVDRIFQIFQRLHGKSEFAGTGIGLAICEKVVTNHGGVLTASSQPGEGATFSVYLPV